MGVFSRFAWTGQQQPEAPKPQPDPRHGAAKGTETAWTTPPAGTGQGAPWAAESVPTMTARGIARDPAWRYGHRGSDQTRAAQAPNNGVSAEHARNAAQRNAARAHGDRNTGRINRHVYSPQPEQGGGFAAGVDVQEGFAGPTTSARAIVHGHLGGGFSDGGSGEFGPVGFRRGESRRWASQRYTSPALGAMYSRNSLRGILPQVVSTPHNQPALAGPANSGIPSNARFQLPTFTRPRIFRTPTPESEIWAAQQAANTGTGGPVIGVGMM